MKASAESGCCEAASVATAKNKFTFVWKRSASAAPTWFPWDLFSSHQTVPTHKVKIIDPPEAEYFANYCWINKYCYNYNCHTSHHLWLLLKTKYKHCSLIKVQCIGTIGTVWCYMTARKGKEREDALCGDRSVREHESKSGNLSEMTTRLSVSLSSCNKRIA